MARHAYWVILVGATPTAFRSSTRDVLVPTWRQLQRTQQDVTLRWFERGRLWESPEAARFGLRAKSPDAEKRRADWRPGGDHRDPRARFELTRDQKRARFKDRARRAREERPSGESGPVPPGDAPQPPDRSKKPWSSDRPPRRPWQRPTTGGTAIGRSRSDRPPRRRAAFARTRVGDRRRRSPQTALQGERTASETPFKPVRGYDRRPGGKRSTPHGRPGSNRMRVQRPFTAGSAGNEAPFTPGGHRPTGFDPKRPFTPRGGFRHRPGRSARNAPSHTGRLGPWHEFRIRSARSNPGGTPARQMAADPSRRAANGLCRPGAIREPFKPIRRSVGLA